MISYLQEAHFKFNDKSWLKVKEYQRCTMLTLIKESRSGYIKNKYGKLQSKESDHRQKQTLYKNKRLILQEDITILSVYAQTTKFQNM